MTHSSVTASQKRTAKQRKSIAAQIAKNEKELEQTRKKLAELSYVLREHTIDNIKKSLALAAQEAPIDPSVSEQEARETVQDFLIDTQAVPVHPFVCEVLTQWLAFDPALITYGEFKGIPVGFIPGLPLLKFVGFLDFDAPTLQEAALLLSMDDSATQH